MIKRNLLFLLFFLSGLSLSGQTITGRVFDVNDRVLESAEVMLMPLTDSTIVSRTMTDAQGHFKLPSKGHKEGVLRISRVGFNTQYTTLKGIEGDVDMGGSFLSFSEETNLKEVVVTSKPIRKSKMITYFPTGVQRQSAGNGYQLLNNMQLSRIEVDVLTNTIKGIGGGVGLFINGMEAGKNEVLTLKPADVKLVQFIDAPSGRYSSYAYVINFVAKIPDAGGRAGMVLQQEKYAGNYLFYGKFYRHRSELNVMYNPSYQNTPNNSSLSRELIGENGEYTRLSEVQPYRSKSNAHLITLSGKFNTDKSNLNLAVSFTAMQVPAYEMLSTLNCSGLYNYRSTARINTSSDEIYPALHYDYSLSFGKSNYLSTWGTYTYKHNTYKRDYNEDAQSEFANYHYLTDASENYQEGNVGLDISWGLKNRQRLSFNGGAFFTFSNVHYKGSDASDAAMNRVLYLAFLTYQKNWEKLTLQAHLGGSVLKYYRGSTRSFWFAQPKLFITYRIDKHNTLKSSTYMGNTSSTLDMLTTALRAIDPVQARRGNPNLKNNGMVTQALNYTWEGDNTSLTFDTQYMVLFEPIKPTVDNEKGIFVHSYINDGYYHDLSFTAGCRQYLFNRHMAASTSVSWSRQSLTGKLKDHDANAYATFGLTYMQGNFSASATAGTVVNSYYMYTRSHNSGYYSLAASYNYKGWNLLLGATNLFTHRNSYSNTMMPLYNSYSSSYSPNLNNQLFVKLSYQFDFSKKSKHNYGDTESYRNSGSAIIRD